MMGRIGRRAFERSGEKVLNIATGWRKLCSRCHNKGKCLYTVMTATATLTIGHVAVSCHLCHQDEFYDVCRKPEYSSKSLFWKSPLPEFIDG